MEDAIIKFRMINNDVKREHLQHSILPKSCILDIWFGKVKYCAEQLTFQPVNGRSDMTVDFLHTSKTKDEIDKLLSLN